MPEAVAPAVARAWAPRWVVPTAGTARTLHLPAPSAEGALCDRVQGTATTTAPLEAYPPGHHAICRVCRAALAELAPPAQWTCATCGAGLYPVTETTFTRRVGAARARNRTGGEHEIVHVRCFEGHGGQLARAADGTPECRQGPVFRVPEASRAPAAPEADSAGGGADGALSGGDDA